MTTGTPGDDVPAPTADQLSAEVARTHRQLGRTMERLDEAVPDPADQTTEGGHTVAEVAQQARDLAGQAASTVRETVTHVVDAARAHTPEAREQLDQATAMAEQAAAQLGQFAAEHTPPHLQEQAGKATAVLRANRKPLLVAAATATATAAGVVALRRLRRRRGLLS
ncbi:hypothetical protein ACIRBX_23080 [Kitasatospora sp. NPDC096147]|uniref:hypothetical protein n=1 Tax=Kitasatospora sp. NPDC096147 TaxID=3364093 RepID=UPI0038222B18